MQFSIARACLLVLITTTTTVLSQTPGFDVITAPAQGSVLTAGSIFNIQWTPSEPAGKISLILLAGDTPQTLLLGATIASSIDSTLGTFAWTVVPKSANLYGLKLQLDSNTTIFQFSFPFTIVGGSNTTSTLPSTTNVSTSAVTVTSKSSISSSTIATTSSVTNSNATITSKVTTTTGTGSGFQTSSSASVSSASTSSTAKPSSGAIANARASVACIFGVLAVAMMMAIL